LILAVAALFPALLVVVLVNLRAVRPDLAKYANPDLPIPLPDGEVVPLAQVVERSKRTPLTAPRPTSPPTDPAKHEERPHEAARAGDLFALAEFLYDEGRFDEALAVYLSVPKGHPQYARARRRAGWHILADERGEPERGVPLGHQALFAKPFDGNSWQDLARVYGRTLGLPVD
jgi:hypothetical protein